MITDHDWIQDRKRTDQMGEEKLKDLIEEAATNRLSLVRIISNTIKITSHRTFQESLRLANAQFFPSNEDICQ